MNPLQPMVSIIIPVFNGANYVKKAIDSALAQTYPNIEIIVVNDGSKDEGATDAIARSYGSKIQYITKENGGVASALNAGIANMHGEYFSWLSHDDMYYPNKIERQIAALTEISDPGAVCACNITVIDEHDQVIATNKIASRANRSIRCFLATDTATGLNGCSLLVPKTLFTQYGSFNPDLKATQDYDLWFRFSEHARFLILDDALVFSRRHDQQGGRTMGNLPTLEADRLHAMMLSKIETAEMREFLGDDIDYLLSAYTTYQNAGYYKTAARLYAAAIAFALDMRDPKRAASLFARRLLPDEDESQKNAREILNALGAQNGMNNKPTILVYSNVWSRGGIERVMSILFEELQHQYNFILVSHRMVEEFEGFAMPDTVCHVVIRPELLSEIPYVLLMLAALSRASLVISNPNIILDALKIYPVMKDSGIKTIACNHYYYFLPTWSSWLYPVMAERLSYLKDATVATWVNTFNANAYALHNHNGATMPNPNTFDHGDVAPSLASENIVLCVGRFYDSIKRLDRALEVFHRVLALKPDARLVLVGGYNLDLKIPASANETIRELLNRLSLPENSLEFVGEQDSMATYYQQASVLIMPSDSEGFSLILTEAGLHGIPSVIFDIPGLNDIITNGVNGYVVMQDDLKGMAEKVVQLLSDDGLRQSMGQKASELAQRFDRKVICDQWSGLINMVLSIDDQAAIEQRLMDCFLVPPSDIQVFTRTLAREYEKGIKTVIQETSLRMTPTVVEKVVFAPASVLAPAPIPVPAPEFTEKEYKVLLVLRRIRNNPIFHFVYADLFKPVFRSGRNGGRWIVKHLTGQ